MEAMEIESVHVDSEELTSADLYHACESNNIEQVMRYIESANINDIINKKLHPSGSTALHIAARKGHNEIVKLLLKNNAFRSTTNNYGLTPIEEARTEETRDLFRRINTRHSFMGNLDDAVIEWVTADSDLVKECNHFRNGTDSLKRYDYLATRELLVEIISYYIKDYLVQSEGLLDTEIKEIEYNFTEALHQRDIIHYLIKAYTSSTANFYNILNKHLAKYWMDYFDEKINFRPNYRLISCLKNIVALLIHHPDFINHHFIGTTYRRMLMTENDLAKYQTGSQIMNLTFLSTSKRIPVAEFFAGEGQQNSFWKTSDRTHIQIPVVCQYKIKNTRTAVDIDSMWISLDEQEVLITPFAAFNVTNVKRHDSSTNSSVLVEIELEEYEYELDLPRTFYDTLALKLPQGVIKDEDQLGRKINNDYSIVCYGVHVSLSTISTLPDVIYIDDDDECKCIAQINLINNKKVCLMITLNFSEYVIPLIHEQQHIQFIYIYQDYQDKFEKNQKWMKSYRKIRSLFIIKDDLITALNKDIEPYPNVMVHADAIFRQKIVTDTREFSISTAVTMPLMAIYQKYVSNDTTKEQKEYIYYYFLTKIILTQKLEMNDQNIELIQDNLFAPKNLYLIHETLNNAYKSRNINKLLTNQRLICHVSQQLVDSSSRFYTYRTQFFTSNELQLLQDNIGALLSFYSFLITTKSYQSAHTIARNYRHDDNLESVLFEIDISNVDMKYACIDSNDNDIIMLPIGTIFRIRTIKQYFNQIWHIELILDNKVLQESQLLTEYFESTIGNSITFSTFGTLLSILGEYNQAQQYYDEIIDIQQSNNDSPLLGCIYNNLALIQSIKGNVEKAMNNYQLALQWLQSHTITDVLNSSRPNTIVSRTVANDNLQMQYLSADDKADNLSAIYGNIATAYQRDNKYNLALKYYRTAIDSTSDEESIEMYENNMVSVLTKQVQQVT
ncbi:unnamed protein product [Didymodactylos carnosus]|uniref:Uncharacterized protein n=1 Tax=Didymodactylos carnosus TaxID=1234261 RepID=A0A815D7G7_9BILA|nr:unnamed protein product [Didymodactylos carnosus]CAF4103490.1 unnamed protein product [Didymodactylos carnosus]